MPTTLELRPLQVEAIEALRALFRQGYKRVILCAPTGFGKTECAIGLIQEAQVRQSRVVLVADRITLVKQTSERLWGYGISHGMAQSTNTFGRSAPIQICSAQTIEKRDYWAGLDLLIVDECHVQRKAVTEFAKNWGGPVIGLSATPLTDGLGETYEAIVNPTTTDQLLAEGWLAPLRIYAASEIDMTGARKTAGEWQASEVRDRGNLIIGDIVSEWVQLTERYFGGPVKTLAFSADVAHGEDICRAFQSAGFDFRQSTFRDSETETFRMVEGFRRGDFVGLVSVEKFVKGFDVPDVQCMIGARPYASSLASVIQQLGRGMRTDPTKEFCLYLDFAGNMEGWYEEVSHIWANGVTELPGGKPSKKRRKEGRERKEVKCHRCKFVIPPGAQDCPYCGAVRQRRTQHEIVPGRMEEVVRPGSREWMGNRQWTWGHICLLATNRQPLDSERARRFALAQYKNLYGEWPPYQWGFAPADGMEPDERVVRKVKQQLIAYHKGRSGA